MAHLRRQKTLLVSAQIMADRIEEFLAAEAENAGKPVGPTATDEMTAALGHLRFFAGAARLLEGWASAAYPEDHVSTIRREPIGVVAQVTPWNHPLLMATCEIAPALAADNTVVLEPSELTPVSTVMLAELAQEFLPSGALNVVRGDQETGQALVDHPVPELVAATRTVRAGRAVVQTAVTGLKRYRLELGGSAPVLVSADADLDEAVETIAVTPYGNTGQDCMAAFRLLAHERIETELHRRFTENVPTTGTGRPDEGGVLHGPLISHRCLGCVAGLVDRLPEHATVPVAGHRVGARASSARPPWLPVGGRTARASSSRSSVRLSPLRCSRRTRRPTPWPRAYSPATTAERCAPFANCPSARPDQHHCPTSGRRMSNGFNFSGLSAAR